MSWMRSETELSQFPRVSLPTLAYKLNEATSGNIYLLLLSIKCRAHSVASSHCEKL